MEDETEQEIESTQELPQESPQEPPKEPKVKRYEHLAIRPDTFVEFRRLKSRCPSDNAFIIELMEAYRQIKNQNI